MVDNNLGQIASGQSTYWRTDRNKIPDFCVPKGIEQQYSAAVPCLDLSSDHTPTLITISTTILETQKPPSLYNQYTDWINFREQLTTSLTTQIPLKTEKDIYIAGEYLNQNIQFAATNKTSSKEESNIPTNIKKQIAEKRRLRKIWQSTGSPAGEKKLNNAANKVKKQLL